MKSFGNPLLVPVNEFFKKSYLAPMMHTIVLYNHVKYKKIVDILEKSGKDIIFEHLIPYNTGIFQKNCSAYTIFNPHAKNQEKFCR